MPVVDNEPAGTRRPHANFDLVVICASAGGIEAMSRIVADLPGDFEAPVLLVQHLGRNESCVNHPRRMATLGGWILERFVRSFTRPAPPPAR
jgi:chemotaxis response regulator CheB